MLSHTWTKYYLVAISWLSDWAPKGILSLLLNVHLAQVHLQDFVLVLLSASAVSSQRASPGITFGQGVVNGRVLWDAIKSQVLILVESWEVHMKLIYKHPNLLKRSSPPREADNSQNWVWRVLGWLLETVQDFQTLAWASTVVHTFGLTVAWAHHLTVSPNSLNKCCIPNCNVSCVL